MRLMGFCIPRLPFYYRYRSTVAKVMTPNRQAIVRYISLNIHHSEKRLKRNEKNGSYYFYLKFVLCMFYDKVR
jgi:hypothetical protein